MPVISDYVIPASSSVSRMYMNLVNCLKTSYLIIPSHSLYPYVNLISCFKTFHSSQDVREQLTVNLGQFSHLIILSHLLQDVRKLGRLFEYLSSDHPIPSSSPVSSLYANLGSTVSSHLIFASILSRMYVILVNRLKTSYLIIASHNLHPSPARKCT